MYYIHNSLFFSFVFFLKRVEGWGKGWKNGKEEVKKRKIEVEWGK